jgi:hypothetical protein
MRQVLSWRFVAALVGLAVSALAINLLFADDSPAAEVEVVSSRSLVKRADLISLVYSIEQDDFSVRRGRTRGQLTLVLDEDRIARIYPGTPGQVSCKKLDRIGQCAVLADLLGDAVVRFKLVPMGRNFTFTLPAIESLDGGLATLIDGWQVPYAPVIDRSRCQEAVPAESFSEFLRLAGDQHRSIFTLAEQQITGVVCPLPDEDG